MSPEEKQVRIFYEIIWNQHDKSVIPDVIHDSFIFRGSLGLEKNGHSGFIEYIDMVHNALGNYTCTILDLVSEQSKVFAKMEFSGIHQKEFMGFKKTGRKISWQGAALFHFDNNKISSLWVLGDLKSLEQQLYV
jgi:predicted ester cyclase